MSRSSLSRGQRSRHPSSSHDRHARRDDLDRRSDDDRSPPRRRHGGRRLVVLLVLLGVLVWFLPVIVARTPLLGWAVGMATGELNGSARIGGASLGWFSPVHASGLQVLDKQGNLVVDLPELSGDKTLVKLATNWRQVGTFTLERPTIHVVLGPDGRTNIEELIAKYLTGPSGKPVAVELKVVDATVHVQDRPGAPPWTIEKLNLAVATSDQDGGPVAVTASGIIADGPQAGRFNVKVQMNPEDRIELQTVGLPLGKLQAILARFAPDVQLAGRLDATVVCRRAAAPTGGDTITQVAAQVNCANFDLACPQMPGDRLRLASLAADGQFTLAGGRLVVERANLQTDVGRAALEGRLELATAEPTALLDSLLRQTFRVTGEVDLARTAAMLPGTLHIEQQTTITRGRLVLDVTSRPDQNGAACHAQLDMTDLAATHRGQPIVWEQPVKATLDARRTAAGVVVDRLECRSSFLTVEGAGDRNRLTAKAQFDLDQLVRQLQGFVNLGVQLAGNGTADLAWQLDSQGAFRADATVGVHSFRLTVPGSPPWEENTLDATLVATGATDFKTATRLDSATVDVKAGTEQLALRLSKPLAEVKSGGPWPVSIETRGNLARVIARAKAWGVPADWSAAGTYHLTANATAGTSNVELDSSTLIFEGLQLIGGGLNVNEPAARVTLAGYYDRGAGRLSLRQARAECSTAAVDANDVLVSMPAGGPMELSGNVAYRGDLARLQGWITAPGASPVWRAYGLVQGQGQLKQAASTTTGQLDATVDRLVLQSADGKQFQEPQARLTVRGVYDQKSRGLKLDEMLVATSALAVRAAGQAEPLGGDMRLNLTGQLGYDWQRVLPLVRPYLGPRVNITGRSDRPFALRGPLDPATAEAAAAIDWSGAYAYGFQVGQGELDAKLAGGVVQFAPLDLAISEGRLAARPRLRLAPAPAVFEVEPGATLQQIRINPDMCAQGLQYIAPILAGVATAEGRFSIALDQCHVRLDDPAQSLVDGRLTVHSVEIGPGALVRELAVVLNRATAAKLQRESVVRFHMEKGRVHHEGLELVFPDMTVRTHGWVGVDQTMGLVAEMPVPPKWTAGNATLQSALKDQVLKVPIRGTLGQPQIDHRKLDEYNRALIGKATQNVIQGELNRQLDRLFQPKQSR